MSPESLSEQLLNFDIDRYLNPYIPHNRLYIFPKPISRWLGYRFGPTKEPYTVLQWPITILGTIAGLCLLSGIGKYAPAILELHPPVIVASFGASAILEFNTIKSPLAQPRNAIVGNTLAAICGVAIAKLFQLNPAFSEIQWVSGAVGCALASLVMGLTNTIHPPGGATAVLASTDASVIGLAWWYPSLVLLYSVLLVAVACIFNNVMRQYPIYWWTAQNVGRKLRQERRDAKDEEQRGKMGESRLALREAISDASSDRTLRRELSNRVDYIDGLEDVHIQPYRIQLPHHVELSDKETMLLVKIQERIRMHGEVG